MKVVIEHVSFDFFGFFLILSLLVLFLGFAFFAVRSKELLLHQASCVFFIAVLFAIMGSKLFSIPFSDWIDMFSAGRIPYPKQLSVTGGLIFLLLGVLVAGKIFKIKVPMYDHFALVLPIAMAVQRLGCFFAGCCNGVPTGNDWGVQYTQNTVAHVCSANHGYIEKMNELTPLLHPVPIYLMLAALFSFTVLLFFKKRIRSKGNLLLLSIALFLMGKFFTEFFRDPLTHGTSGKFFAGLMLNQWALLVIIGVISLVVFIKRGGVL